MKKIMNKLTVLLLPFCIFCKESPVENKKDPIDIPVPAGWKLVWNDEFAGKTLDLSKWSYEVNAKGGGNNELQYYTDRAVNLKIENGVLVISALKEHYSGSEGVREYTSARIRTKKKGDWKYGRFDIRARLPYGKGIWPAVWMMPTDEVYGGWAASGEIDIMELLGHEPNKIYGTLHYGGSFPSNVQKGDSYRLPSGNFSDEYHIFTLEWQAGEMRWYVDGILFQTQTQWYTANGEFPAPFNQRFYMIFNLAVGGNWPGNPNFSTEFPQKLMIDYVRIFKANE